MATKEDPSIDFDDLNWDNREYNESVAYSQSKLPNYLHALGASMKYPPDKRIYLDQCASRMGDESIGPVRHAENDRGRVFRQYGHRYLEEDVVVERGYH